ncbi:MAG: RnfABCDGE type electron transport complex subunit G [Treponema sp.]|jgi:electron transport complex protein RnfG|nr:RnfABCDGE type electron transport complex subunit G [Treponema sp.]
MKNMLKLGIILALFAAVACVMLAFVYSGTTAIIVRRQQTDLEAALKELFPGADSFTEITAIKSPDLSVTIESQYKALRGTETAGAALQVSRGSYGGPIKVLVGISAEGIVSGVKILEHQDTPGLGANAASPSYFVDRAAGITFYSQFAGKAISDPFEVRNDVEAITASTITSRAVADAVKAAGTGVAAWLAEEAADAYKETVEDQASGEGVE